MTKAEFNSFCESCEYFEYSKLNTKLVCITCKERFNFNKRDMAPMHYVRKDSIGRIRS